MTRRIKIELLDEHGQCRARKVTKEITDVEQADNIFSDLQSDLNCIEREYLESQEEDNETC